MVLILAISVKHRKPFLPEGTTQSLECIGIRLIGFSLIISGIFLITALVSYYPGDSSWNTAADTPTSNILGHLGAVLSDLLLQTIGFAALLPISCLLVWGIRFMTEQTVSNIVLRTLTAIIASVLVAVGLAVLPRSLFWPLTTSPGGFTGGLALEWLGHLSIISLSYDARWVVAVLATISGLASFLFSLGIIWSRWWIVILLATIGNYLVLRVLVLVQFLRYAIWNNKMSNSTSTAISIRDIFQGIRRNRTISSASNTIKQQTVESILDSSPYQLPPLHFLTVPSGQFCCLNKDNLVQIACSLESVLNDFGVYGKIVKVRPGPVVTLCELEPVLGTKIARIISLSNDIACAMGISAVRISVVPGQNVVSIELPNTKREVICLRELLSSNNFDSGAGQLMLALGKDIYGIPVYVDLVRMPHLLIAGTIQSVTIDSIILSLLYKLSPVNCRLVVIDSQTLGLSIYNGIPHLLFPVVTDKYRAILTIQWAVQEMENRYRAMSQLGARNISGYNQRIIKARTAGQTLNRIVQTGFDLETGKPIYETQPLDLDFMPFIVLIVGEIADLMLSASEEIESAIQRLAHTARTVGIHLIAVTQRPSSDVITDTLRASFPARISFQAASKIDSRTVLGEQGAEQLLGQGDMLYMTSGGRITRVHGSFIATYDIEQIVRYLRVQSKLAQTDVVNIASVDDNIL